MRRFLGYALMGLLAYAVFMLIQFPATALIDVIAQRLPGFSVQDVRGSALRGSAQGVRLRGVQFESLSWQWRFLPLFLGRIGYRFSLVAPELRLDGNIATGLDRQLHLADLRGGLPLPKLAALLGRPALPLSGQLELDADSLQFTSAGRLYEASGMIRLLGAHTTLGQPLALGDFSAELNTKDQDIAGKVKDNGGPLELNGILTLTPEGSYRFSGQAAVRDGDNRELRQALNLLGRPGGDGRWKLNFNGTL